MATPSTTLSSYALTTLADAKRYAGIMTSADDTLLTQIINACTDRIERLCNRKLVARDFCEKWSSVHDGTVMLRQAPVNCVYRIACGQRNAVSVVYSGTAVRATIGVYEDCVRLHTVGSDGTTTNTVKTFSENPTTDLLATAISSVSGWTATALVSLPSTDLFPRPGWSSKDETVYLVAPSSSIDVYDFDADTCRLRLPFVSGWIRNLLVHYNAGFETIPDDLAQICNEMVAQAYRSRSVNRALKSETIGDYSYTLADVDAVVNGVVVDRLAAAALSRYTRYIV